MSQVIEAVLFDIGNVVLHFSHERMCRQIASVLGSEPGRVREAIFRDDLVERYDSGRISTADFMARLSGLATGEFPPEDLIEAAADIFDLNEPLVPIIEALDDRGLTLVTLSNTCEVHSDYFLEKYPIFERFDSLVLSHRCGTRKPEPEIFELAVRQAGVEAGACLFVDDIDEYARAARSHGLQAHTFAGLEGLVRTLEDAGVGDMRGQAKGPQA